jgi:exodeoxyribonuclease VIII
MYKPEIITNAEYHGRKTHLSSTNVRTFNKNKKQFKYGLTHELVKQTKAMADGTAVHSFFLERDNFNTDYVTKPSDIKLNTKVGKEWAQEHQSKIIIDSEFSSNLLEMEKSFMDSPAKIIYNKNMGGQTELSYFWDDLGLVKGKCRPDWISDDGSIVIDLKTTIDASPKGFQKSISNWGYHLQLGWYLRGLQKLGLDSYDFIFIAIEKTPPFSVGVYRADQEMINYAMNKLDEIVPEIDKALAAQEFPDYTPEITSIGLPPWMTNKKEQPQLQEQEEVELY